MSMRKKNFKQDVPTSVILPIPLQRAIVARAVAEERSFSAIVRRALKKELGLPDAGEPDLAEAKPSK